jgi:hypothetical protein
MWSCRPDSGTGAKRHVKGQHVIEATRVTLSSHLTSFTHTLKLQPAHFQLSPTASHFSAIQHSDMLPDLMPLVFSFLQDDRQTLRACALVHRTWTTAAQVVLFHTVDIPHFKPEEDDSRGTRCLLLDVLYQSPHLQPLIRTLLIHDRYTRDLRYFDTATPRCLFPNVTKIYVPDSIPCDIFLNHVPSLQSVDCPHDMGRVTKVLPHLRLTALTIHFFEEAISQRDWLSESVVANTLRMLSLVVDYFYPKSSDFRSFLLDMPCLETLQINLGEGEYSFFPQHRSIR